MSIIESARLFFFFSRKSSARDIVHQPTESGVMPALGDWRRELVGEWNLEM